MEAEKMGCHSIVISSNKEDEEDDIPLPGFRFHPTDEELVGFYLRRKVENRPISIELIKQIDIYKYDPWDLPKGSNVGDKEWYFFCKRGRKYRNSIRPNRVTGSGFWKATGIDRPIFSSAGGEGRDCIGLKKSLVYYRGSAGKGTKTDWMMHEFRLPADHHTTTSKNIIFHPKNMSQEAEVWTLCRIFKRNASYRKHMPHWSEIAAKRIASDSRPREGYISFNTTAAAAAAAAITSSPVNVRLINACNSKKQCNNAASSKTSSLQSLLAPEQHGLWRCATPSTSVVTSSYSTLLSTADHNVKDQLLNKYGEWDELRSVVDLGLVDPSFI